MATPVKVGKLTKILAADIADADHPINQVTPTAFDGAENCGKVIGEIYLRDNGTNDYDFAIPIEAGSTGKWVIIGTGGAVITPS